MELIKKYFIDNPKKYKKFTKIFLLNNKEGIKIFNIVCNNN